MGAAECPSENALSAFLDGKGEPSVHRHLGECGACRGLIAELLRADGVEPPAPGRRVGSYQLLSELGHGGMGVVYRAHDTHLKRDVAVKFLAPRILGHADAVARFRREAQAAASLRHPNVAALFESGEADGLRYLVFELVDGEPLSSRLARGPLDEPEALRILGELVGGVVAAHAAGVIHRDLKPSNVMLGSSVKLLDFGLAKLPAEHAQSLALITLSREVLGTLAYMAPEQQEGEADDPRIDVWAIGAVAYHMVTGTPPFGLHPAEIARSLASGTLVPPRKLAPALSRDLETLILQCLSEAPARRPSAQALAEDVARLQRGEPISLRRSSLAYRMTKRLRRNLVAAVAGMVALVGIAAAGTYGLLVRQNAAERDRLSRELGQSAQQIRSTLRNAHLLPLHDTRPERAAVTAQMEQIAREMARAGSEGVGPGNAALGQGWLALGSFKKARPHLEAAWAAGERGPDLAAALGFTLATVYDRETQIARRIPDLKEREAKLAELGRTLRDQALSYLRSAEGAVDTTPEYVAGCAALLEKRYEEAAELGHQAFAKSQSLYEAGHLEATALHILGRNKWKEENDHAQGKLLFARMREVQDKVLEVARSDDAIYTEVADRDREVIWLIGLTGEDVTALDRRVSLLLDKAITANPDNAEARTQRAHLYVQQAEIAVNRSQDPRELVVKALAEGDLALPLAPKNWKLLRVMGDAAAIRAEYEVVHAIDPREALQRALKAYQESLRINDHPETFQCLGIAYTDLAEWEVKHGLDPRASVQRAVEAYGKAIKADYEYPPHLGTAAALAHAVVFLVNSGGDPGPSYKQAVQELALDLRTNGDRWQAHRDAALLHTEFAIYLLRTGKPADGEVKAAQAALSRAKPLGEPTPYFLATTAVVFRLVALAALLEGGDPGPPLAQARAAAQRALKMAPDDYYAALASAEIESLAARRQKDRTLARAQVAAERAVKIDPSLPTLLLAAEVQRRSGRAEAARAHLQRALGYSQEVAAAHYQLSLLDHDEAQLAAARKIDPFVDGLDQRLKKLGLP